MSNKEKLLASAQKNLQKGQVAKAIKDYQQIVGLDPKDIRNRQKLAELFCRAGMTAEALGEFAAVAAYYGDNGFYLKAIAVYKQMQKLDPELVNVYHRLAELNVKQGLVGNAQAEYRNLLALFERKKFLSESIGVLQKMAELEPENLNIRVKIAELYAQSGLREKAREVLAEILEQLHEAEDFSRLSRLYELFLPFFPADPEILAGFGQALVRRGDSERGLQILTELLQANPEHKRLLSKCIYEKLHGEDSGNEKIHHDISRVCEQASQDEILIAAATDAPSFAEAVHPEIDDIPAEVDAEPKSQPSSIESSCAADASLPSDALSDTVEPGEAFTEAEEIPLGFLESAVTSRTESPPETLSATPSTPSLTLADDYAPINPAEELADDTATSFADEMEFELEFVLDDPSSGTVLIPEPLALPTDDVIVEEVEADCPLHDTEGALDDIEELVELDALEDVDADEELTIVDLPEESEVEPAVAAHSTDVFSADSFDGGLTASELGDLLSDLEEVVGSAPDLGDELDEAEFYLQQGLLDDAERVCRQILEVDAKCSAAREKLSEVSTRRRTAAAADCSVESELLPADSADADIESFAGDWDALAAGQRVEHSEVFDLFNIGVETPIDVEDAETHYNLGIAYKEMGLLDEAVAEFDKALKNPERMVDSLVLKGTCLFIKGDFEQAEKIFKSGLAYSALNADERLSLNYEMGLLYEAWGRLLEALDCFQSVADADLFFRNVGDKIENLRKNLGLDVDSVKEDLGGRSSRGRVSYI